MKLTKKHSKKKTNCLHFYNLFFYLTYLQSGTQSFFFVLFFSNFCFTKFYNFYVLYEGNAKK